MEKIDIVRFKSGDEVLFQEIVNSYGERLYNIVFRILRNEDDAEEIVQETFVRAYLKRKGFKGRSSIYTWLVRIAYNLSLNFIKKRKPMSELSPDLTTGDSPESKLERQEVAEQIDKAIGHLPPKQRAVFMLRFYEDMSYKNIVKILKCKEGTAKALYHFAAEKLSNELGNLLT